MTTNLKMFNAEFYIAGLEEDSDPDPTLTVDADNLDDIITAIAKLFPDVGDVELQFLYVNDADDVYAVNDTFDLRALGVALVRVR